MFSSKMIINDFFLHLISQIVRGLQMVVLFLSISRVFHMILLTRTSHSAISNNWSISDMVNGNIGLRAAPGAPPILHTGVGGAGNVRLVDSRRMRPVYVKNPNGLITANGNNSFGVAPTRVTPAGSGMNGGGGGGNGTNGIGMRRVAYISPVSTYFHVIIRITIICYDLSLI